MTISNWVPNYNKYNEYLDTVNSVYFEGFDDEEEEYFKHVREVNELIDFEGYLKNLNDFYDTDNLNIINDIKVLEYIIEVKNIVKEDFSKYTKEIEIGILKNYHTELLELCDAEENEYVKNNYYERALKVSDYLPSFDADDVRNFLYGYIEKNGKFDIEFIPKLIEIIRDDAPGIIDMWDECLYDFIEDFINNY